MESTFDRRFALLIVDDEPNILSSVKRLFRNAPYEIYTAEDGVAALELLRQTPIDAALVDLRMPQMDGMTLLSEIRSKWPSVRVIILTGFGGVQEAVAAIKLGATDFLQKPFEDESLQARVAQLFKMWGLERENRQLKDQMKFSFGFERLIGNSTAMLNLKRMILQVARSEASILIQGETGTGKELVAGAIHFHSPRNSGPFVAVDCAGISETVIGSELFGHVKGAFTGAHENTQGLIRSADKGTLFLDEVGELPLSMQVKLLRTIQEKEVRPVGSNRTYPVDVRILAATNRNLEEEVAQGRFRQDLYYRLNVVVMTSPPLRERLEDIPLLMRHFIQQSRNGAAAAPGVSKDALACLMTYEWPGNVRELENVIRRAVAMGRGDQIALQDLPETIYMSPDASNSVQGGNAIVADDSFQAYEYAAIRNALVKCNNNRKKAALLLGIGEATLYRKIKLYQL